MTPLVALEGVEYRYAGGPAVLSGIDMEVHPGQVAAVIGPSGCGKSTILSLVAGSFTPTKGTIRWDDESSGGDRRRLVTMVFQKDTVLPWLTTEQNVGFGLRYERGLSKSQRSSRVAELLALGGLSRAAKKYPYQLSGGMRRRVAFLTAVAPFPRLLLLDEPFSSLDEPTRVAIHASVLSVVHALNMSVVLVTHDLAEAISLSDQVYLLSAGPGCVVRTQPIPLGTDRDIYNIRAHDEYQRIYADLWQRLSAESWGGAGPQGTQVAMGKVRGGLA